MKNNSRMFLVLAFVASLGLTACQKTETPSPPSEKPTNAAPEKKPDHPEHPKQ
jgi:hypothetical protein